MNKFNRLARKSLTAIIASAFILQPALAQTNNGSPYPSIPLNLQDKLYTPPNVMVFLDTSMSMVYDINGVPTVFSVINNKPQPISKLDSRMVIANRTIKKLIADNSKVRWGLFTFDNRAPFNLWSTKNPAEKAKSFSGWNAGRLIVPIDDYSDQHVTDLNTGLDSAQANTTMDQYKKDSKGRYAKNVAGKYVKLRDGSGAGTPIGEAYIEMLHYFAGLPSGYRESYDSIKDKLSMPGIRGAIKSQSYISPIQYRCQQNYIILVTDGVPNHDDWLGDNSSAVLGQIQTHPFPTYINENYDHDSIFDLPDVSKDAYQNNFAPTSGVDKENVAFNAADASKQNINTFTVGFTEDATYANELLTSAATGKGRYYSALDESSLAEALHQDLQDIMSVVTSSSTPASSDSSDASLLGFNTTHWSGSLTSYKLDPVNIKIIGSPLSATSTASNRLVFTKFNNTFQAITPSMSTDTVTFGTYPESTLRFLLGQEPDSNTLNPWRKRNGNLLGDFIHTSLVISSNGKFMAAGANDGLLHIFAGDPTSANPYDEVLAYAPSATLSKVQYVAQNDYGYDTNPHRYLVDGPISSQKLDLTSQNPDATEILVGALGRGGKGYYALDLSKVSNGKPGSQDISKIALWDLNSTDTGVWNDNGSALGYTFGKPVIAQMSIGGKKKWEVIVSNGFDSGKKGTIYFLDALKGTLDAEINLGTDGAKSGLGDLTVVDSNGDNLADTIYAGDQNGDVWRINLDSSNVNKSRVGKLWSGDSSQPITAPIEVDKISYGKYVVVFGTGSLIYSNDQQNKDTQTLYGIYDDISKPVVGLSYNSDTQRADGKLLQQSIVESKTIDGNSYREVSRNALPNDGSKQGWYLDLPKTNSGTLSSERITQQMQIDKHGIFFSTQIPKSANANHCSSSSGEGWIMAVSALNGSAPNSAIFSTPMAQSIDFANGKTPPAGFKTEGMPSGIKMSGTKIDPSTVIIYSTDKNAAENSQTPPPSILGLNKQNSIAQSARLSWREISQQ